MAKLCFRVLVAMFLLASYASEMNAQKSGQDIETKKGIMAGPPG